MKTCVKFQKKQKKLGLSMGFKIKQVTIRELEKEIFKDMYFERKIKREDIFPDYLSYEFFKDKSGVMKIHSHCNWKLNGKEIYYSRFDKKIKDFLDRINIYDNEKGIFAASTGLYPKYILNISHCEEFNSFLKKLGIKYNLPFRKDGVMGRGIMIYNNKNAIHEIKHGIKDVNELHLFLKKINEKIPEFLETLL